MPVAPTEETRSTRNPETFSALPLRADFQVVQSPTERITVAPAEPAGQNFAERAVATVTGLAEEDATLITFGRTLLRENKVSSEIWADMVRLFGRQHTIDLLGIMGDYLRVGIMLNAVNQQQPPTRPALLPPLDRDR